MSPKVKLTYIFILKYDIVGFKNTPTSINLTKSQIKSEKYNLNSVDIMNFMSIYNSSSAWAIMRSSWKMR